MKVRFTEPLQKQLPKLSADIRRKFEKQLSFLLKDMRYPSLHAKKYDEAEDIWQGRVNGAHRFYWRIVDDAYEILAIKHHPE